ncbi:hypothetical protein F2Q70_00038161 [Brassica cretica]|uniref:Uncharacterized protein n=1 Tax=Brassica cretica TaxID=69181 RepID=A0A8S9KCU4_BRACR|nr:hypothetical protein F2Q70_00038161 [Brassica cretica]
MKQTYGMRFHNPVCYCEAEGHVQRGGLNSGHRANHGGIRLMDTWFGRFGHYGDGGMEGMSRRTAGRRVEKLLTRRLSKPSCVALVSFVCAWAIKRFGVSLEVWRPSLLDDVLGEVHGDVPSERWKVEALTQGEFSKDAFIEEAWKDCSCVKPVSSGVAGWDLCMCA